VRSQWHLEASTFPCSLFVEPAATNEGRTLRPASWSGPPRANKDTPASDVGRYLLHAAPADWPRQTGCRNRLRTLPRWRGKEEGGGEQPLPANPAALLAERREVDFIPFQLHG